MIPRLRTPSRPFGFRSAALGVFAAVLAACATTTPPRTLDALTSASDFASTEARLRSAIDARGLTLFTVVDHGQGARSVGGDIGDSKLFVFGNPRAGTPLMEAEPAMGLVLPLRVLVYTDDEGRTRLLSSEMDTLAETYAVDGQDARVARIDGTLDAVVAEAAGR